MTIASPTAGSTRRSDRRRPRGRDRTMHTADWPPRRSRSPRSRHRRTASSLSSSLPNARREPHPGAATESALGIGRRCSRDSSRTTARPTVPGRTGFVGHALPIFECGERERRRTGHKVDVVGYGDLGDAALDGLRRVGVDRNVGVRREVGVDMGVERQVARLSTDIRTSRTGNLHFSRR